MKKVKEFTMRSDIVTIKKIDIMAAKVNMSRTEYINRLLESHIAKDSVAEVEETYSTLVKNIATILENNTREVKELNQKVDDVDLRLREIGGLMDEEDI